MSGLFFVIATITSFYDLKIENKIVNSKKIE